MFTQYLAVFNLSVIVNALVRERVLEKKAICTIKITQQIKCFNRHTEFKKLKVFKRYRTEFLHPEYTVCLLLFVAKLTKMAYI